MALDIRPRTTGEILDDAFRLFWADAPVLLALSSVFLMPALLVVLLQVGWPAGESLLRPMLLAAALATALPLTGLASAACQEVLRRRAEGQRATLGSGLRAAFTGGLSHLAVRAATLALAGLLAFCLLCPALAVWSGLTSALASLDDEGAASGGGGLLLPLVTLCLALPLWLVWNYTATVHAILAAGEFRWPGALREASRQCQRQFGKTAVVMLMRGPLGVLAVCTLHSAGGLLLLLLDAFIGLDVGLADHALSPFANPIYYTALLGLSLLLLNPYFEATHYLLYLDARTRHEGLDLWYRVRRLFPVSARALAGMLVLAVAAGSAVQAADRRRMVVRDARQELARVVEQVKSTEPYPGPDRWLPPLRTLGKRLDEQAGARPGGFAWFKYGLDEFEQAKQDRDRALAVLNGLDQRLSLIEESLPAGDGPPGKSREEIRSLLPANDDKVRPRPDPTKKVDAERPVRRDDEFGERPARRSGDGGVIPPLPVGGLSTLAWGLLLAILTAGCVVALVLWRKQRPARSATKPQAGELSLEALLAQTDRPIGESLWKQADDLARAGNLLEAVRTLYLAVLALLHRADLIRYAQTRTNHEYLAQVRPHSEVHAPFEGLTGLFELKFYGEKSCQPDDYQACRQLAERVRAELS
ncbi:MAG: DUF4129 domain-containing protein [Planctomycetia bacterium]|nr:DUF4129 domain-containing protein [Planctomycetia bacterium]